MLTRRLQEERSILLLEMAQHCTWLQNQTVILQKNLAREGKGNDGLCCLLRRRLAEVSERLQAVLQQYKTALGPEASVLQIEEDNQIAISSPETNEDEEDNTT